jgi:CheY-like chemotaxis protein
MTKPPPNAGATAPFALIVEDDPDAAEVADGMLRILGFRTRVCPDAHAALYALSEGRPDLLLLDICLPEMDGVNLMKVTRRIQEHKELPVIAASAIYPRNSPVEHALKQLGVPVYLSKPFSLDALRAAVRQVLPAWREGRGTPQPPGSAPPVHVTANLPGASDLELRAGDAHTLLIAGKGSPPKSATSLQIQLKFRELRDGTALDAEATVLATVSSVRADGDG